ncbi:hypothetical protein [Fibrella forsythiae]|uniref:Outer membrane protein beta-barrel domain-containing protein n=1 Tax=Fibrella forsythiae TaxID=2817061 RepID=A0ABS3JL48_9BACT|nr:hypothetical protein [Fibrella forsythiae]MBO0950718.1 hypothetical protein [Fibrella forsythiae]
MKRVFLLLSCLVTVLPVLAQTPYVPARNSIQIGADHFGIDPANGLKYRFALDYRRYASRDRLSLGVSAGFMSSQRLTVLVPDFVSVGTNSRRRVTLDLTATYNLLHSVHHALRIGGGPSAWFSDDDLFVKVYPYPIPSGSPIYAVRSLSKNWNLGGHATVEYTYALALNTQVSLHGGAAIVGSSGVIPFLGFRAGYRF